MEFLTSWEVFDRGAGRDGPICIFVVHKDRAVTRRNAVIVIPAAQITIDLVPFAELRLALAVIVCHRKPWPLDLLIVSSKGPVVLVRRDKDDLNRHITSSHCLVSFGEVRSKLLARRAPVPTKVDAHGLFAAQRFVGALSLAIRVFGRALSQQRWAK